MNPKLTSWYSAPLVSMLLRFFLGVLFLYAGVVKTIDPPGFAQILSDYRLLPVSLVSPVASLLPWVEITVGMSMLLGIWIEGGALVASGLLIIFAFAVGISLLRGVNVDCGCFSTTVSSDPITWFTLVRDMILLAVGAHILVFDQGMASLERVVGKKIS